ncbi:aromatic amino acid ammonia-lyase [Micromonospora sp. DT233]|uniref:aromatic amino acid ammonia-lyase n=1 Tax=Micromonospora sp. DT233 TaxID=3393432 RepID=UPI003CF0067C
MTTRYEDTRTERDRPPTDRPADRWASMAELVGTALAGEELDLTGADVGRMEDAVEQLSRHRSAGGQVYGLTRGFGPLVRYPAGDDENVQGIGLVHHLCTGQGVPVSASASALSVWLRLQSMRLGYSAVPVPLWRQIAELHRRGFVPVMPSEGSLSASGDLVPLAHAALALGGAGHAWHEGAVVAAGQRLAGLAAAPVHWPARTALAFVNGSSVSLAVAALNHLEIDAQARALCAITGRLAALLGCNPQAYADGLQRARGHPGARRAAGWIRQEMPDGGAPSTDRPLQEPYSLRCVPQVVGAVVDQLAAQERILLVEAAGCTDNPVVVDGDVLHGGNFHALPVAFAADQHTVLAHQLAYLAERQLALLVDPATNGGRPPFLCPLPGQFSGLAGVQIAASSMVAKCRQHALPATVTAIPSNLNNQDHVPMALNAATAAAEAVRLTWLVIGSLMVAVAQLHWLAGTELPRRPGWQGLATRFTPLREDRPLANEVRAAATAARAGWGTPLLGSSMTGLPRGEFW